VVVVICVLQHFKNAPPSGFAYIGNGFHKAGGVVDGPQAIVARNHISGS
jgi:hypothetical protein